MIEIKNKHMIIFPEDRLIGARGDVDSAQRKFVLSRVQDGFDLSNMVAWIKIDPTGSGAEPYDQMLKKEISGDRIVLTWRLSGANLKDAGELSAQIIFASPDYFNQNDLANLSDNALIVPSAIKGVSAPVWQSYPETFVVSESIDDTVAYEEITKNVLVAAAASAVASAESAQEAAESAASAEGEAWQAVAEVSKKAKEVEEAALVTIELKDEMQGIANEAKTATQEANKAADDANQAAINANAVREEVEAGGYIESLKEMNEGEKFSFWVGTQAEYDADPDKLTENRLHIITDEDNIDKILDRLTQNEEAIKAEQEKSLSDRGIHYFSEKIILENDLPAYNVISIERACTSVFGLSSLPSNLIISSCDSRANAVHCSISHSKGEDNFKVYIRNIAGTTISAGYEIWYTLIALEI